MAKQAAPGPKPLSATTATSHAANVRKAASRSATATKPKSTKAPSRTSRPQTFRKTPAISTKRRIAAIPRPKTTIDYTPDAPSEIAAKTVKTTVTKNADDRVVTTGFRFGPAQLVKSLRLVKRQAEMVLTLFILPVLLSVLGTELASANRPLWRAAVGALLTIVSVIWVTASSLCIYYFSLQVVRGRRPRLREVYRQGLVFSPRLIGASLLFMVMVIGGFALLVLPGLIVLRRYCLTPFYIVDGNLGIREALAKSAAQSKPLASAIYGVLAVQVMLGIVAYALSKYVPVYGGIIGTMVTLTYIFGPALLYKAVSDLQA